jgi:HPt (histidine-containing phosphotransfer) domain-containing protein
MENEVVTLDIDEALQRFSGNRQVFIRLLNRFVELNVSIEEKSREATKAGNSADMAMFFHSIKGGAGNLSAKRLYHMAAMLEDLSRAGDVGAVQKELPAFFDLFAQLKTVAADLENPSA